MENANRSLEVGPFVCFVFEKGTRQDNGLTAAFTINIGDPKHRARELLRLAGIGDSTYVELNQERIPGMPLTPEVAADGPTTVTHKVQFTFIPEQIEKFRMPSVEAVLGIAHPAYSHMAVIMPDLRAELAKDFA